MTEELYGDRAGLYDLIYSGKDYRAEADRIAAILTEEGVPPGSRVLDVACGTGEHLATLARRYAVAGLDLNPAMLAIARKKLPTALLLEADMEEFSVEKSFDALLCLFSSIGYLHGKKALRRGARAFAGAVRPGGVVILEPWLSREAYREGTPHLHTYESEDLKVARAAVSGIRDDVAVIDFRWLVARRDGSIESFGERHELWFCPYPLLESVFRDAGIPLAYREEGLTPGRGLFVGRRE